MKIASNLQGLLLPDKLAMDGYEITAYIKPALDVGGDYSRIPGDHTVPTVEHCE